MSGSVAGSARVELPFPRWMVALAGLGLAFLTGAAMARGIPTGIGLLFLIAYTPLVLLNLPAALAIWISLMFIKNLSALSVGPTLAGLLLLGGWIGTLAARSRVANGLAYQRSTAAGAMLLMIWMSLSTLWATDPGAVWSKAWQWYIAAVILVLVAGTVRTRRHAELAAAGFVTGAFLSVVIGLLGGGITGGADTLETATQTEGRLQGGSGDPNYLAAGIVPALALAGGLLRLWREPMARFALGSAILVLTVGLVATESRGGMVAAIVALLAGLVIMRDRRLAIVALLVAMTGAAGAYVIVDPDAGARITGAGNAESGQGRTELWTIAWRVGRDRPVLGAGLDNFADTGPRYVFEAGELEFAERITENPHVVHNAYLQAFSELGAVGLILLVVVYLGAIRAALVAARRFRARGDPGGEALAQALAVALIGMMTAAVFLSNGEDNRLWFLLGLAPALLGVAVRGSRSA